MMGLDNPIHIAFLLILLLLVFGAKRLPEMGRSLGSGLRGFRDSLSGEESSARLHAQPAAVRGDELTMPVPVTSDAVNERIPVRPVA
jgi:sec-independent protein translocase protein TatA